MREHVGDLLDSQLLHLFDWPRLLTQICEKYRSNFRMLNCKGIIYLMHGQGLKNINIICCHFNIGKAYTVCKQMCDLRDSWPSQKLRWQTVETQIVCVYTLRKSLIDIQWMMLMTPLNWKYQTVLLSRVPGCIIKHTLPKKQVFRVMSLVFVFKKLRLVKKLNGSGVGRWTDDWF